jgi:hypothetical protein
LAVHVCCDEDEGGAEEELWLLVWG